MSRIQAQFGTIQSQFDKVDQYAQGVQAKLDTAETNWSGTLTQVQQSHTVIGQRVKDLESSLSAAPAATPSGPHVSPSELRTLESKLDKWAQDVGARMAEVTWPAALWVMPSENFRPT